MPGGRTDARTNSHGLCDDSRSASGPHRALARDAELSRRRDAGGALGRGDRPGATARPGADAARVLQIDYASLKRRLTADGASATDAGPSLVDMGAAVDIPGAPRGAYSRVLRGYWWPETAKGAGEGALRGIRCKFVAS